MADGEGDVEVVSADDEEVVPSPSAGKEDEIDYKALLAKEVAEKENYKAALREERSKRRELEKKPEEVQAEEDEESKIAKVVRKELEPLTVALTGNKVEQILSTLAKDPDKQNLIKFYYENRIVRTGTSDSAIRNDLEAALNMADGAKLRKENQELKRMNDNKDTIPLSGGGADRGVDRAKHGYSQAQVADLTKKAQQLNIKDTNKFIEQTWANEQKMKQR